MKQDGTYLADLCFHISLIRNGINITQSSEPYWDQIVKRSETLLGAIKKYYDGVAHPDCAFSLDKEAKERGKEVIAKLELLDSKIKGKDREASLDAVKQLEDHLKDIL